MEVNRNPESSGTSSNPWLSLDTYWGFQKSEGYILKEKTGVFHF
jgi:hypothetical protein